MRTSGQEYGLSFVDRWAVDIHRAMQSRSFLRMPRAKQAWPEERRC